VAVATQCDSWNLADGHHCPSQHCGHAGNPSYCLQVPISLSLFYSSCATFPRFWPTPCKTATAKEHKKKKGRIVILGSGSSSGNPHPGCILEGTIHTEKCRIARQALIGNPAENKDYRCNPSILIHTQPENKFIQIDAGKTFRESMVRWYPRIGVKGLDAIVLTHDHADAILGLDDVRGLQVGCSCIDDLPAFFVVVYGEG
jgi:hypothetical protein